MHNGLSQSSAGSFNLSVWPTKYAMSSRNDGLYVPLACWTFHRPDLLISVLAECLPNQSET